VVDDREAPVSDPVLDPFTPRPDDPQALQILDPYPGKKIARHAKLAVTWESKGITRDLGPNLISLDYTDNLSGAADDLTFEIQDRDMKWSTDWRPTFGDSVVARLEVSESWFADVEDLRLGKFAHDSVGFSGPPHRASFKCVSAPLATGLRRRKRTRVWRGQRLDQIAKDIADRAGLTLQFDGDQGDAFGHAQQVDKSDLEFLEEICKQVGRTLKVGEDKIIVFDEAQIDQGDSVGTIDLIGGKVLTWSFDGDDSDRYGTCHVTFFDPKSGKEQKGEFVDKNNPDGQTLELRVPVSSQGEATKRAKALLRNANRFATKGKLTTIGDPGLVAGVIFDLTNSGGFDGKFIITRAEHRVGGGYIASLDVRRCLEGY
jgi:phage protein D